MDRAMRYLDNSIWPATQISAGFSDGTGSGRCLNRLSLNKLTNIE